MEIVKNDKKVSDFGVILLIEDDEIVMEVNKAMLEKMGYTVVESIRGQIAVDAAKDSSMQLDLAMLDMDMPDMKGPEIFQHLKTFRPSLKVIVCSGQIEDATVKALLDNGADDFIQKPFTYKGLQEMIIKHLDRRHDPRFKTLDNFISVSEDHTVRNIRIIDISKGGFSFACGQSRGDKDALIDVAVIMAEKGVNLDELECRIVSDKNLDPGDPETGAALKRKGVSFGKMTKQQFDKLSELINVSSGKN